jgi:hypothetical protein
MPATEDYPHLQTELDSPAQGVFLITPSDTDELAHVTRGISFATAGDLKVVTLAGETVVIPSGALAAGVQHAIRITRVLATGSGSGMGLVGYY